MHTRSNNNNRYIENMRSIVESINDSREFDEARQIHYQVAFNDTKDEEGIPYTVDIYVDYKYKRDFDKFVEKQEGDAFMHACNDDESICY